MGGRWYHPHLLKSPDKAAKPDVWSLNPNNVREVIDGMYGVVNENGGTGGRARLPFVDVCGKTGSSQVASFEITKGSSAKNLKDNGWFEAFAPCHAPEIVVVALWDHGEHGWLAAPIVKDVMTAYFDKKKRMAEQAQEQAKSLAAKMASLSNLALPEAGLQQGGTGLKPVNPDVQSRDRESRVSRQGGVPPIQAPKSVVLE